VFVVPGRVIREFVRWALVTDLARRGVGGPCFTFVDGTCTERMCCAMAGSSVCTLCPAGSFSNSTGAEMAGCLLVQLCVRSCVRSLREGACVQERRTRVYACLAGRGRTRQHQVWHCSVR
jgi:hypothetical protein